MSFTPDQTKALEAPLNSANVKSREQAGRKLSYVESWHAIAEANRIFGFDGWTRETVDLRQLVEREHDGKFRVSYSAKVRVVVFTTEGGRLITREGCGYGSGIDKDLGQAHESALKEAESDAMKRALMTFGNPFGLALYDKTQANVETGPQRSPDAVRMATETIKMCKTLDEAKSWGAKNSDSLKANLHPDDYDDIARILKAHANTLKVMADTGARPASQMNGAREEAAA